MHISHVLLLLSAFIGALCPGLARDPDPYQDSVSKSPEVVEGGRKGSRRLVLVLHGGSYQPRTPRELAERALEPLEETARQLGLRLVAPMVPEGWLSWGRVDRIDVDSAPVDASTVWASPRGEALILALIDREVRRNRADPRRVYLAGHGAGASSAFQLAARHPERFAALALWSGTPSPEWAPPDAEASSDTSPDTSSRTGSGSGSAPGRGTSAGKHLRAPRSRPGVVGLVGEPVPRLAGVPVYLWTGAQDDILDRGALALFVERMREHEARDLGHELVWETGPGGHDYGPGGAKAGLQFLKQRRKATTRKGGPAD